MLFENLLFGPFSVYYLAQTICSPSMDGWMTCDFMSFSTIFQSYQDDGWMIMKGVCNGAPFTVEKISVKRGLNPGPLDSRLALNPLSYRGSCSPWKGLYN